MTVHIPKAELHVHIEGTMSPVLARKLAARRGMTLDPALFTADGMRYAPFAKDGGTALPGFLHAYHSVVKALQGAEDYYDLAYDYLIRAAEDGCIYVEYIISRDHGMDAGLSYIDMVDAIADGCHAAREKTGIESRLISAVVRDFGVDKAMAAAQDARDNPHPMVTGFSIAGNENTLTFADFKPAFDIARGAGLGLTAHAGEAAGPQSVRDAWDVLGVTRFGHMVRAAEDADLLRTLADAGAVPEVCVSSNMVLRLYDDISQHPLKTLRDAGCRVTLATDDPAFFDCRIGGEYAVAQTAFGFTDEDLVQVTRNAIDAAFCDDALKSELHARIDVETK